MEGIKDKLSKIVGTLGLLIGPLFLPLVFAHIFAMGSFSLGEILSSGVFAFVLVAYSVAVLIGIIKSEKLILLSLSLYIILGVELGARLIIKSNDSAYKSNKLWAKSTFKNQGEFKGHPFLQFAGTNKVYRGFPTVPFKIARNKIRVVAMGGSTTAGGYPALLDEVLGEQVEVLNFGQAFFTSAHTMVNYFLNVVDLKPEYIVLHQGWNDNVARNAGKEFSSDYAHALKSWELPFIPDLYLIRFSALYRFIKDKLTPFPSWRFIDSNLQVKRNQTSENYKDLRELKPFKRNIRSILLGAKANGTKVVLTTQPFVSSGKNVDPMMGLHIEQCNEIMRSLANEYKTEVLFVDLYKLMQGKDQLFTDFAHVNIAGWKLKAQHIGQAIKANLEAAK